MRPESRQCFADARASAIEAMTLSRDNWRDDRITSLAIERLLMTIGEAFVRLRSIEPALLEQVTDASKIIGMRNVLVHGYDAIDSRRIEDALRESLPILVAEIGKLVGD